ncbi:MAG: aromatic ring-hydroxylating oxygenase subunit alpha, partial [Acetobacteraceae bacterium]
MTEAARPEIAALLRSRRAGFPLEAPFYVSPEVFALDLDLIFARHWLHVAVEPEMAEPGDFVTVELGTASIILLRDDEGQIRGFRNVCRHRGARLVNEPRGFVGNLVCPYHNWTYDLSGRLVHAGIMGRDFDPSCLGLKRVAVRCIEGLVFACLAEEPVEDIEEMAADISPYLAPHNVANLKVAHQSDLIENGNWKLVMENNRECFHCANHPELLRSYPHLTAVGAQAVSAEERADYEAFLRLHGEFEAIWEAEGLPWRAIEKLDGRATGYRTQRLALEGAGESFTLDARAACAKPTGRFGSARLGSLHLHTQPNSWNHFLGDHAVVFSVFPIAADKTLVRSRWLVAKDAVEGIDYDLSRLTEVWNATNVQDASFVGWAQAGA